MNKIDRNVPRAEPDSGEVMNTITHWIVNALDRNKAARRAGPTIIM